MSICCCPRRPGGRNFSSALLGVYRIYTALGEANSEVARALAWLNGAAIGAEPDLADGPTSRADLSRALAAVDLVEHGLNAFVDKLGPSHLGSDACGMREATPHEGRSRKHTVFSDPFADLKAATRPGGHA